MRSIPIGNNHAFLYDYNLLINNELEPTIKGYLKNSPLELSPKVYSVTPAQIKNTAGRLDKITFEITQDCNLRCRYCVYGGSYKNKRQHTSLCMKTDIARQSLEYIHNLIKDKYPRQLKIAFYGGEPLLGFETIQDIVQYSRKLFQDWQLQFAITTNGTLLNEKIAKYLVSNNFTILVSLDGSEKNNDAKRIYRDGKGTFKDVWKNISSIQKKFPLFFNRKVFISAIYSWDLPLLETFNFFSKNRLISGNGIFFSKVNNLNTDYYKNTPEHPCYKSDLKTILEQLKNRIRTDGELKKPIEKSFGAMDFDQMDVNRFSPLLGFCDVPERVYIDVEGQFHICEKINEKFPIGNVWNGFDIEAIVRIYQKALRLREKCGDCKIRYLCNVCFSHLASDGSWELATSFCESQNKQLIGNLHDYIELYSQITKKDTITPRQKSSVPAKQFHQFVVIEKGPANTAIADLLEGNLFQVDNITMERFEKEQYHEIDDMMALVESENLTLNVKTGVVIPKLKQQESWEKKKFDIRLEIDNGVEIKKIAKALKGIKIAQVIYYGEQEIQHLFPGTDIKYSRKDFALCLQKVKENKEFARINKAAYFISKSINSCWGNNIAVTSDYLIRPCIHSEIVLADLNNLDRDQLFHDVEFYWYLTKDKVEKCKDCELRYFCFDCREIANRERGSLFAPQPNCRYNPYTGIWVE